MATSQIWTLGLTSSLVRTCASWGTPACSQAWAPGISRVCRGPGGGGPEPLVPPMATAATCRLCVCCAEPSHCLSPSLCHTVLSSQPHQPPNGHCLDVGGTYCERRGEIEGRPSTGTRWDRSLSLSYTHPSGMSLTMNLTTLAYSVPCPPSHHRCEQGGARQ